MCCSGAVSRDPGEFPTESISPWLAVKSLPHNNAHARNHYFVQPISYREGHELSNYYITAHTELYY